MEYAIDDESKYTTLHIRATLVWKDMNKKWKIDIDANPPRGNGERARKSLLKRFYFIIIGYNIRKLKYQKPLGPYTGWNQDLTTLQNL